MIKRYNRIYRTSEGNLALRVESNRNIPLKWKPPVGVFETMWEFASGKPCHLLRGCAFLAPEISYLDVELPRSHRVWSWRLVPGSGRSWVNKVPTPHTGATQFTRDDDDDEESTTSVAHDRKSHTLRVPSITSNRIHYHTRGRRERRQIYGMLFIFLFFPSFVPSLCFFLFGVLFVGWRESRFFAPRNVIYWFALAIYFSEQAAETFQEAIRHGLHQARAGFREGRTST